MEQVYATLLVQAALVAATWMSPRAIAWVTSLLLARREALRVHRLAMKWHLSRFDAEDGRGYVKPEAKPKMLKESKRHLLWKNWYLARFDAEDGR
ncbi:MAG TPA: hypothetical protein VJQ59_16865 [Candidatus Sulfotelmatobacter sp.]|nr:hypothetical protein [Candidatus Sulfotelmatobacter sp.]